MPKVSVIVPNYNHESFLEERLNSIFNQTYTDYEVILLDDNSTDQSAQILKQYALRPNVSHFVVNDQNSGSTFIQWKRGIDLAIGKYIWFAESDDVAEPDLLRKLVEALDNNPQAGVAFAQSLIIDADGNVINEDASWFGENDLKIEKGSIRCIKGLVALRKYFILQNGILNASAVCFRSDVFRAIPDRYTTFKYAGDWLIWVQLLALCDLCVVYEYLNKFRLHAEVSRIISRDKKIFFLIERYKIAITARSLVGHTKEVEDVLRNIFFAIAKRENLNRPWRRPQRRLIVELSEWDPFFMFRLLKYLIRRIFLKYFS